MEIEQFQLLITNEIFIVIFKRINFIEYKSNVS
jgi:hypothetical protein